MCVGHHMGACKGFVEHLQSAGGSLLEVQTTRMSGAASIRLRTRSHSFLQASIKGWQQSFLDGSQSSQCEMSKYAWSRRESVCALRRRVCGVG